MKIANKRFISTIVLLLLATMAVSMLALPTVNAPDYITFAYIHVSPNPIGVGQDAFVVVWIDKTMAGVAVTNNYRFQNYSVIVTKPDNTTERLMWDPDGNEPYIVSDPTSSAYTKFTPAETGTYNFLFLFPEQSRSQYHYFASNASTTLTVQEEPLPAAFDSYPLPTEYWTRPIEEQNTWWYQISSSWYNSVRDRNYGGNLNVRVQPDGVAPGSAHIMWAAPINPDISELAGSSFAKKSPLFARQIIMYGKLYYRVPSGEDPEGLGWMIVDLRTGEEQYYYTGDDVPSFGYYYNADYYNQHGVLPDGIIFTDDYASAIDAIELAREG